jgi:hypothetical protein
MSKATETELAELHGSIARGLRSIIETPTESGPASAAYFMAGLAMLKQNNITADPEQNSDLKALADRLTAKRQKSKTDLLARSDMLDSAANQFEHELTRMMK